MEGNRERLSEKDDCIQPIEMLKSHLAKTKQPDIMGDDMGHN